MAVSLRLMSPMALYYHPPHPSMLYCLLPLRLQQCHQPTINGMTYAHHLSRSSIHRPLLTLWISDTHSITPCFFPAMLQRPVLTTLQWILRAALILVTLTTIPMEWMTIQHILPSALIINSNRWRQQDTNLCPLFISKVDSSLPTLAHWSPQQPQQPPTSALINVRFAIAVLLESTIYNVIFECTRAISHTLACAAASPSHVRMHWRGTYAWKKSVATPLRSKPWNPLVSAGTRIFKVCPAPPPISALHSFWSPFPNGYITNCHHHRFISFSIPYGPQRSVNKTTTIPLYTQLLYSPSPFLSFENSLLYL